MLRIAVRKESKDDVREAGDYAIFDLHEGRQASGIKFCCPHAGCGDICHLPCHLGEDPTGWHWEEKTKTLSPSIQRLDKERCHHHFSLINGEWVP